MEVPELNSTVCIIGLVGCIIGLYLMKQSGAVVSLKRSKHNLGPKGRATVIAHRGSRSEGLPENTISAFKDAILAGAHVVELDVWLSRDGNVVVHHDKDFSRMCGTEFSQLIYETDYAAFPSIVPPANQTERCSLYPKVEIHTIPLLSEVLSVIPLNIAVIIEFKQNSTKLIELVKKLVVQFNRQNSIYWFSLDEKINCQLRNADTTIPSITSVPNMMKTLLLYYTGLLPYYDLDDAVFGITVDEITIERIRHEAALKALPDWIKQLLAVLFRGRPPTIMIAPALFTHLRQRGIPVWFLGVNNESDLQLAVQSGATAVLTDRVNWLCEQLEDTKRNKRTDFQSIVEE